MLDADPPDRKPDIGPSVPVSSARVALSALWVSRGAWSRSLDAHSPPPGAVEKLVRESPEVLVEKRKDSLSPNSLKWGSRQGNFEGTGAIL